MPSDDRRKHGDVTEPDDLRATIRAAVSGWVDRIRAHAPKCADEPFLDMAAGIQLCECIEGALLARDARVRDAAVEACAAAISDFAAVDYAHDKWMLARLQSFLLRTLRGASAGHGVGGDAGDKAIPEGTARSASEPRDHQVAPCNAPASPATSTRDELKRGPKGGISLEQGTPLPTGDIPPDYYAFSSKRRTSTGDEASDALLERLEYVRHWCTRCAAESAHKNCGRCNYETMRIEPRPDSLAAAALIRAQADSERDLRAQATALEAACNENAADVMRLQGELGEARGRAAALQAALRRAISAAEHARPWIPAIEAGCRTIVNEALADANRALADTGEGGE